MKEEATLKFPLRLMPDIDAIRGRHSTLHRKRQRIFPLSGLRYSLEQLSRRAVESCTRQSPVTAYGVRLDIPGYPRQPMEEEGELRSLGGTIPSKSGASLTCLEASSIIRS